MFCNVNALTQNSAK